MISIHEIHLVHHRDVMNRFKNNLALLTHFYIKKRTQKYLGK